MAKFIIACMPGSGEHFRDKGGREAGWGSIFALYKHWKLAADPAEPRTFTGQFFILFYCFPLFFFHLAGLFSALLHLSAQLHHFRVCKTPHTLSKEELPPWACDKVKDPDNISSGVEVLDAQSTRVPGSIKLHKVCCSLGGGLNLLVAISGLFPRNPNILFFAALYKPPTSEREERQRVR